MSDYILLGGYILVGLITVVCMVGWWRAARDRDDAIADASHEFERAERAARRLREAGRS